MGSIRKISIALTEELAAEVDSAVASGDYASNSEVIREALRAWKAHRAAREAEIARLRRLWDEGIASGDPQPFDRDFIEGVKARGLARLAAESRPDDR